MLHWSGLTTEEVHEQSETSTSRFTHRLARRSQSEEGNGHIMADDRHRRNGYMRQWKKGLRVVLLLMVLAMVAAACSSDSDDTTTTAAAGETTTT
jgi:hypothetical protein